LNSRWRPSLEIDALLPDCFSVGHLAGYPDVPVHTAALSATALFTTLTARGLFISGKHNAIILLAIFWISSCGFTPQLYAAAGFAD